MFVCTEQNTKRGNCKWSLKRKGCIGIVDLVNFEKNGNFEEFSVLIANMYMNVYNIKMAGDIEY